MDYTTWRITYQSAEQAARAAYKSAQQHLLLVENLRYAGNRVIRGGEGAHVWDLALQNLPEESPLRARIEELEEEASQATAEREALLAHQAALVRELTACQSILHQLAHAGEVTPQYADDAKVVLKRTKEASLAQRDAEVIASLRFPTMLRKMWSGGDVQRWLNEQAEEKRRQAEEINHG